MTEKLFERNQGTLLQVIGKGGPGYVLGHLAKNGYESGISNEKLYALIDQEAAKISELVGVRVVRWTAR